MRRSIVYIAIASTVFVAGFQNMAVGQSQMVPQAMTSAGPALVTDGTGAILAWDGELGPPRAVGYNTYGQTSAGTGVFKPQKTVSDAHTTVAPALGANGENMYLVMRGDSTRR
jgi:hypothetical protein